MSEKKKEPRKISSHEVLVFASLMITSGAVLCGVPWRVACGFMMIMATVVGVVMWAKERPRGLTHCAECDSKFEGQHSGWLCRKCGDKHWDGKLVCATKLWRLLQAVEAAAGENATVADLAKKRHKYGKAGANGEVVIGLQKTDED